MFIDENTSREALEEVAIVDIGFEPSVVDAASTEELRAMIIKWVNEGSEV